MPIYDFKCKKCNYEEEYIVKDYLEIKVCPKCNTTMHKEIGAANFRLYGEGFHKPNKK